MEAQKKVDTKDLESKIAQLQKNLVSTPDLIKIIHRPGWTTIIQVEQAAHLLDAMNQQAAAMQAMSSALASHVAQSVRS